MRRLRLAAPVQLELDMDQRAPTPVERWWSLPETAKTAVVVLLARMIAAGVMVADEEVGRDGTDH